MLVSVAAEPHREVKWKRPGQRFFIGWLQFKLA
jgi:hypothetical protein